MINVFATIAVVVFLLFVAWLLYNWTIGLLCPVSKCTFCSGAFWPCEDQGFMETERAGGLLPAICIHCCVKRGERALYENED
jgi:hypothetical protein